MSAMTKGHTELYVVSSGVPVQFRMPLIPGLNDDADNIYAIANILTSLRAEGRPSVELMPYHRLGMGKYEALGQDYCLKEIDMASEETIEAAKKRFEERGIKCLVSK